MYTLRVRAFLVFVVSLTAACTYTPPPQKMAPILVRVDGAPGERVADAEVVAGGVVVARSDDAGLARLDVRGAEGEVFDLSVRCPSGYRSPAAPIHVRRVEIAGATATPEYAVTCTRTRHELVVAVLAENGPNLPVLYLGKEVARTDGSGAAHVRLEMNANDHAELTIGTSDAGADTEKLHPQNPSAVFEMHESDDVQLFAVTFTRDRKKTAPRVAPRGPIAF